MSGQQLRTDELSSPGSVSSEGPWEDVCMGNLLDCTTALSTPLDCSCFNVRPSASMYRKETAYRILNGKPQYSTACSSEHTLHAAPSPTFN